MGVLIIFMKLRYEGSKLIKTTVCKMLMFYIATKPVALNSKKEKLYDF